MSWIDVTNARTSTSPASWRFSWRRAGGDPADGLAGRGATAAAVVAETVLGRISEVGVRGAELLTHLFVGLGPGVGIAHQHGQGVASGAPLEQARKEFDRIGLLRES